MNTIRLVSGYGIHDSLYTLTYRGKALSGSFRGIVPSLRLAKSLGASYVVIDRADRKPYRRNIDAMLKRLSREGDV